MPTRAFCAAVSLLLSTISANAGAQVLIAGKQAPGAALEVAQVFGARSRLSWLSVRVPGAARFALVTSDGATNGTDATDVWLRALDFGSRVRVAPPSDFARACPALTPALADSGAAEPARILPSSSSVAASELELRRALEQAEVDAGVDDVASFSAAVAGPYRLSWYDAPSTGGASAAVSLPLAGGSRELPRIWLALGAAELPLSVLALSAQALAPVATPTLPLGAIDPLSGLAVEYWARGGVCDYDAKRAAWRAPSSGDWLLEAIQPSVCFVPASLPGWSLLDPLAARYFRALPDASDRERCVTQVANAQFAGSRLESDYECAGATDLARTLSALDFADPVLSRYFGTLHGAESAAFAPAASASEPPLLIASSANTSPCSAQTSGPSDTPGGTPNNPSPGDAPGNPTPSQPPSSSASGGGEVYVGTDSDYVERSEGCSVSSSGDDASDTSTSDSCSGDSSSSSSTSDSCSGDSSSSSSTSTSDSCSGDSSSSSSTSTSDSCSGDSSSSSSTSDSCSGDSSSSSSTSTSTSDSCSGDSSSSSSTSSSDSSGCGSHGSSGGDSCSGSSASRSGGTDTQELALGRHTEKKPRVRVSLVSMMACCFMLPLRRCGRRRRR